MRETTTGPVADPQVSAEARQDALFYLNGLMTFVNGNNGGVTLSFDDVKPGDREAVLLLIGILGDRAHGPRQSGGADHG